MGDTPSIKNHQKNFNNQHIHGSRYALTAEFRLKNRHCERSESISFFSIEIRFMDCFATLAMMENFLPFISQPPAGERKKVTIPQLSPRKILVKCLRKKQSTITRISAGSGSGFK